MIHHPYIYIHIYPYIIYGGLPVPILHDLMAFFPTGNVSQLHWKKETPMNSPSQIKKWRFHSGIRENMQFGSRASMAQTKSTGSLAIALENTWGELWAVLKKIQVANCCGFCWANMTTGHRLCDFFGELGSLLYPNGVGQIDFLKSIQNYPLHWFQPARSLSPRFLHVALFKNDGYPMTPC